MSDEQTPLLYDFGQASGSSNERLGDHHNQFCHLIGIRPLNLPEEQKHKSHPESLYHRATHQKRQQHLMYAFTAALTNTLIMTQIVLGAALTGLGASNASPVLVTVFGAMNTIIAGAIAFLKSRGQPMRARMFRDDLSRVVDEIENSAIMWLGISKNAHGYDAIDTDDQVTVRGEVARLTRLYDKAVKTNTLNDPDNYSMGGPSDPHSAALRDKSGLPVPAAAPSAPAAEATSSAPASAAAPAAPHDVDASPATKAPEPPKPDAPAADATKTTDTSASSDKGKEPADSNAKPSTSSAAPQPSISVTANTASQSASLPTAPPVDPDASPASAANLPEKHSEDTSKDDDPKK